MVALEYIARASRRHDTVMAWAFRRALGITAHTRCPSVAGRGLQLDARRYDGIARCMENRGRSPVEWGGA